MRKNILRIVSVFIVVAAIGSGGYYWFTSRAEARSAAR